MADFVVEQYQRQIGKKQEVIDQYTNEIEDLESRIETEKELRHIVTGKQIGRAHVWTPVTAHYLVCRLLL